MSYVSHLVGLGSGARYPADRPMNLCPVDQRPVAMIYDLARLSDDYPGDRWVDRSRRDLWRFGPLLPLHPGVPDDARYIVSLGEGATPLREYADHPVARRAAFRLRVKEEGKAVNGFGANPTLSFKDRGMSVVASMARRFGIERLAVPTQGNAGDSLATYALAAGLEVVVAMPRDTPMPILGRVAALSRMHPGVTLELVDGTIADAGRLLREQYLPRGYFDCATFREPGWRIEGKKTLGLELAEPEEHGGHWRVPDAIVYPTGGGTGVLGMAKAFDELECLGLIDGRRPRMICVQSDRTAPLVTAYERGADDSVACEAGRTLATGLNVPGGIGHFRVLGIVRESGGAVVAVSEAQIAAALRATWRDKGWWIGPEGAAALAALPRCVEQGLVGSGDDVVVVNTGSFEKYLPEVRHLL